MKRYIALIIIGVVIGAALMNLYLSRRMDDLYIANENTKVELYESSERLKKLEAKWQQQQLLRVREIEVIFVHSKSNPLLELRLREHVLKLTKDLLGEEIKKVPHPLVMHLIDQRQLEVDEKNYRLAVRTMVLAEKVTFFLSYALVSEPFVDEP